MSIEDDVRRKLNDEINGSGELVRQTEETLYQSDSFYSESNNSNNITFNLDDITIKNLKMIILVNKIMGVMNIISGAFASITIIGLIIGIPTILIGLKLLEASKSLESLQYNKKGNEVKQYFAAYGKACKYTLILIAASIIFFILYIIFIIGIIGFFAYQIN